MTGLARVYRALDNIADNAKLGNGGKIDNAVQSLVEFGAEAAHKEYGGSGAEGAADVQVSGSLTAQEGVVTATGAKILFVEFGAGINLNNGSIQGGEWGYTPTSWSTSDAGWGFLEGKRLATFQGWWPVKASVPGSQEVTFVSPKGKKVTLKHAVQGNAPVNAMYHTAEKMKQMVGKFLEAAYR